MARFHKRGIPRNQHATVQLGGADIDIVLTWHARARRMILRPDTRGDGGIVTLPPGASVKSGIEFARERADWLLEQISKRESPVIFADGVNIPYQGTAHEIRSVEARGRGVVVVDGNRLLVSGRREHLARRLTDWLRKQARERITRLVDDKAAVTGRRRGRISIRDTRSRWGSCSASGSLNFSWRLILAPEWVLDYVVAHEVAHLSEHNHSPAFWAIVDDLTVHRVPAQRWLRDHGSQLHRYG